MSIIPTNFKNALFSLFLLGIVSAMLAFWLIAEPSVKKIPQTEQDDWQMFVFKQKDDIAFLNKLRDQHLWESENENAESEDIDNAEKNVPKDDWQLLGIINEGRMQYALLQDKSGKIQRYQADDVLEEGIELVAIYEDSIEIKKVEENIIKELYAQTLAEMPKIQEQPNNANKNRGNRNQNNKNSNRNRGRKNK